MKLLVTGGAGFIGSHFVNFWLSRYPADRVVTLDKLTYAGRKENLGDALRSPRHRFIKGDIGHLPTVRRALEKVDAVVNFAAETHVDRSLLDADPFLRTNVQGSYTLVNAARLAKVPRFLHVSTDEVYGSVERGRSLETDVLDPTSPYAASKAASDGIIRTAWLTHGYPVLITRCTNNFGPGQHPEKFLPLFITNAMDGLPVPVYGKGLNQRNWIHVLDHCEAVAAVLRRGKAGEIYNVSAPNEYRNIDVARRILRLLGRPDSLLQYVKDRAGHDKRYAPDSGKIRRALGWKPRRPFETELPKLVDWYRDNQDLWRPLKKGGFQKYYQKQYAQRLAGK